MHDIVTDSIPRPYDLILSRHTMQHLKTKDVKNILQNFVNSGSKYLLATNYPYLEVEFIHQKFILNLVFLISEESRA